MALLAQDLLFMQRDTKNGAPVWLLITMGRIFGKNLRGIGIRRCHMGLVTAITKLIKQLVMLKSLKVS